MSKQLFSWKKVLWEHCWSGSRWYVRPRCPHCNCELKQSTFGRLLDSYEYQCIDCDFKITLDKDIEEMSTLCVKKIEAEDFKGAEIINIDNELIKVQRKYEKDDDYWVDAKISKNRKGELQLMVMAGSNKESDKAQLFIEPSIEKVSFDQNNKHPREVFTKIEATFKNSKSKINAKK